MKAVVFERPGPPDVLVYGDVPDPTVRPGGLVIEVKAIGLQGGDLVNRSATQPAGPHHVVGYQASGVVHELGDSAIGFDVGDRVVATMMQGSHAEWAAVSARKTWKLPDELSFEEASAIPIEFGTANDALFEFGHLRSGETVLIHGAAGGVGLAAVQLAHRAGATVVASAGDNDRLARLSHYGADHLLNYRTDDLVNRVRELTNGHGADLVFDPVGGRTLETSIGALAYRGRISWVGNARRDVVDMWPLMEKNGSLTPQFFAMEQSRQPERVHPMVAEQLQRIAAGELRVAIDRVFPLSAAAAAHAYAEQQHPFGRVVILPSGGS
jgi:NADPH:quinone reductase